ncbi:MAG: hypothetical protein WDM71_11680 [Ferruginibacter sp.]
MCHHQNGLKKTIELNLVIKDSVMMMAGSWTTNWTKKYHPVTGTIELQRKNDYWHADPLIQKLDTMKLSTNLSFVKIRMQPETADVTKNNVSSPIAKVTSCSCETSNNSACGRSSRKENFRHTNCFF